ncbi:MAG: hypothetical protein AAGC73_04180 [Verrucomicrobiota bacterium]
MAKTKKVSFKKTNGYLEEPAGLAAEYLRGLAVSLESFGEFDSFLQALKTFVADDGYFSGEAALAAAGSHEDSLPDFEGLKDDETVIAVAGKAGNSGYLKYSNKSDKKPFGVQDLHLMSAIAGCLSSMIAQAERFQRNQRAHSVLQFLINQLPIGVLCYGHDGQLILESNLAKRMLGDAGLEAFQAQVAPTQGSGKEDRVQLHFEVGDKLIYAEGRAFKVEPGASVRAFVLYDMSSSRTKLLNELDRVAYMSESRGAGAVLALFESRTAVGETYRTMKRMSSELGLEPGHIQPLDAYSCGCLFTEKSLSDIRFLLKVRLKEVALDGLKVAFVPTQSLKVTEDPGEAWVRQARKRLAPVADAFLPELVVMQDYGPVLESLELILSDECRLRPVKDRDEAIEWIQSGRIDGVFVGLDAIDYTDLELVKAAIKMAGAGFAVFYTTFTRKKMAMRQYDLTENDKILEKPFDSDAIVEAVALKFDLG